MVDNFGVSSSFMLCDISKFVSNKHNDSFLNIMTFGIINSVTATYLVSLLIRLNPFRSFRIRNLVKIKKNDSTMLVDRSLVGCQYEKN